MPEPALPYSWREAQQHFPKQEVARLRQQLLDERRRGEYTDAHLMARYRMGRQTFYNTVARYATATQPEDYVDRPHAAKDPHRKYTPQDVERLRRLRQQDEATIEKKGMNSRRNSPRTARSSPRRTGPASATACGAPAWGIAG